MKNNNAWKRERMTIEKAYALASEQSTDEAKQYFVKIAKSLEKKKADHDQQMQLKAKGKIYFDDGMKNPDGTAYRKDGETLYSYTMDTLDGRIDIYKGITDIWVKEIGERKMKNAEIIECLEKVLGLAKDTLKTYQQWKKAGYQVKKGQKAYVYTDLWKKQGSRFVMAGAYLFTDNQVESVLPF